LAYVDLWLAQPRAWAMSGLLELPTSERLAMSRLQVLAMPGLQVSASFDSEVQACSKAKSPVAHTLSQPKAPSRRSSQSLLSNSSL